MDPERLRRRASTRGPGRRCFWGCARCLLGELVEIARSQGDADLLFQAAVSNLPDLARWPVIMLVGRPRRTQRAWKAGALPAWRPCRSSTDSRTARPGPTAGPPRDWPLDLDDPATSGRGSKTSPAAIDGGGWSMKATTWEDAVEAVRNFLAGRDFDAAFGSRYPPVSMPCDGSWSPVGDRGASRARCSKPFPTITAT